MSFLYSLSLSIFIIIKTLPFLMLAVQYIVSWRQHSTNEKCSEIFQKPFSLANNLYKSL